MRRSAICLVALILSCAWISDAHGGSARAVARPLRPGTALKVQQRLQAKYGSEMARQAKVLQMNRPVGGRSLADVIAKAQTAANSHNPSKQEDLKAMWQLLRAARSGELGASAPAGLPDLQKLAAQFSATLPAADSDTPLLDLPVPENVPPAPAGGADQLIRKLQRTNPAVVQKAMQILRNPKAADPAVQAALRGVLQQKGPDGKPTRAAEGLRRLMNDPKQVDKLEQIVGVLRDLKPPTAAKKPSVLAPARNPFAAPAKPAARKAPRLKLTGVMASPGGNVAILNGRPVRAGQTVAGFKVIKIEARRVTLGKDGKQIALPLAR